MREIVIDTETTGFDPNDGHRVVEVGCVELINKRPSGKTWHGYYIPDVLPPHVNDAHHLIDVLPLERRGVTEAKPGKRQG